MRRSLKHIVRVGVAWLVFAALSACGSGGFVSGAVEAGVSEAGDGGTIVIGTRGDGAALDGSSANDGPLGAEAGCAAPTSLECSGTCVDPTLPAHCGTCSNVCPPPDGGTGTATCTAGTCGLGCSGATSLDCNGSCVDPTLPSHCGSCTLSCPAATTGNGTAVCTLGADGGGTCSVNCTDASSQACPSGSGFACYALDDPNHCNGCGTVCPGPASGNGSPTCSGAPLACGITCTQGTYHLCANDCHPNTDTPSVTTGTIFLDEIGELPAEIQPKLLRALQAKEIKSVGGRDYRRIDVRVVAATLRDMHTEVNEGRFRADLFHRFNKVEVRLPALRERSEDIPDLVAKFLSEFGDPGAVTRIDNASRDRLLRYDWPGNVRELRNVIEVAFELSHGGPIEVPELGARGARAAGAEGPVRPSFSRPYEAQRQEHLDTFDRAYFSPLLRESGGNLSEVARVAGLDRATIRERLERVGLRNRGGK